jgi:hypothetical protein
LRKLNWLALILMAVGLAVLAAFFARQQSLEGAQAAALPRQETGLVAMVERATAELRKTSSRPSKPRDDESAAAATPESKPPVPEKPLSLFPQGKLEGATARICYFSFNNAREYMTTKRFVGQLNAHSPIQIEVLEFVREDDDIEDALLAGMRSGQHCDGVVLSGHHRGKFCIIAASSGATVRVAA